MNENKHVSEGMVRNEVYETSEIINEMPEETENEVSQSMEDVNDRDTEVIDEEVNNETSKIKAGPTSLPAKVNKHVRAMHLVEKTKKIIKTVNDREEACRLLLETDLKEYENAKAKLKTDGFDACVSLVKKLGSQTKNDAEKKTVPFESKEESKPMVLKEISSGRFTALIYALLGGVAVAIGLVYLATEKLEMTLNVTKVPTEYEIQSILAWFSTLLGLYEDVYIGAGVLGVLVLSVMIFIYVTRVRVKANCNLHFAVKQFIEAELYIEKTPDCKADVDKIDMHIKDTIEIMRTYGILFNEQKGKLERILYIEGERGKSTEYHYKSHREIYETTTLIDTISDYMNIPLLEEGKLSEKSVLYLQHAKDQMDKMLAKYY